VHYVGKLLDGTIFDSSRNRDESFTFKVGGSQVIKGWEEGVQSMKKGSVLVKFHISLSGETSLFTVQPEYAYGASGSSPSIPPNATLQFEIELLSWIEEKDVSMAKDGGVLKRVTTEGEGWEKPKDDTKVIGNLKSNLKSKNVKQVTLSSSLLLELSLKRRKTLNS
jgi:FK506-binding protein 4/5